MLPGHEPAVVATVQRPHGTSACLIMAPSNVTSGWTRQGPFPCPPGLPWPHNTDPHPRTQPKPAVTRPLPQAPGTDVGLVTMRHVLPSPLKAPPSGHPLGYRVSATPSLRTTSSTPRCQGPRRSTSPYQAQVPFPALRVRSPGPGQGTAVGPRPLTPTLLPLRRPGQAGDGTLNGD